MSNALPYVVKQDHIALHSPTRLPNASHFLWNNQMMLHVNCRGFATGQFMQPEPAKYAHGPALSATTFMQPEHHYYAHHPGRFFYLKDEDTKQTYSLPFEPMRKQPDKFEFKVYSHQLIWTIEVLEVVIEICLTLATNDAAELWQVSLKNISDSPKRLSLYPYFSIGYMSWMNQGADFNQSLNAVVAHSVTPYQKVAQYYQQNQFKDKTALIAAQPPCSWTTHANGFEGLGGLNNPDALQQSCLANSPSCYEPPIAVLQYRLQLEPKASKQYQFVFAPAKDEQEIEQLKNRYLNNGFDQHLADYQHYLARGQGSLAIKTADSQFNQIINQWLPRQVFYHGDVNRLSTDPQTRNYLQDALGMCYVDANISRQAFVTALSQQHRNGAMPDGILLHKDACLKYINQVPHTDHNVWLPICLRAYFNETADYALLRQTVPFSDDEQTISVFDHIELALDYLISKRDHRGLSYIEQGDWCDPMNMVGHKGKGVSTWLTLASAYALQQWASICDDIGLDVQAKQHREQARQLNHAVNQHCWDGHWYNRGFTDDGRAFGSASDAQGEIFLNPQSWALLANTADTDKQTKLLSAIKHKLHTPYGAMMLAPSFTHMHEDIGRVTQKYPGTAENGAVYNHASAFYAYGLCKIGEYQAAFDQLSLMLPNLADAEVRDQLPNFIPNYYRGAYHQIPSHAGRSSQLFNTGTVAWVYRCLIEEIIGLSGHKGDLVVAPHLPKQWQYIQLTRHFAGAQFDVTIKQAQVKEGQITLDGQRINTNRITNIVPGQRYQLEVIQPKLDSHPCAQAPMTSAETC
ncbi:GH36-type glycosyl hydrolase domain-containing protein [Shewanella waksmanii]|uniref:GH36-type glycosyl hydrolase domain-containing protein n=1 Tax=Shewanella waksmanii TaxID=213783 RepID=UPI00373548AC